jgi:hypothetical protein
MEAQTPQGSYKRWSKLDRTSAPSFKPQYWHTFGASEAAASNQMSSPHAAMMIMLVQGL